MKGLYWNGFIRPLARYLCLLCVIRDRVPKRTIGVRTGDLNDRCALARRAKQRAYRVV